jgi:hypothetical protein
MRPARPQNYVLASFYESVSTPCRISTEHLNPDLSREVPGKETTEHIFHIYPRDH